MFLHPFRIHWLYTSFPEPSPAQLLIAVPKHALHKAVERNLVKRRIRESYRKNKHILYEPLVRHQKQILIGLIYCPKEILPYSLIEDKIIVFLQRLTDEYAKNTG